MHDLLLEHQQELRPGSATAHKVETLFTAENVRS
jgi:hypothetical protein